VDLITVAVNDNLKYAYTLYTV